MINRFYKSTSLQTLFKKSQFTIFAITFIISTFTLATISVFTVESYAKQNLQLISRTASERIQPALVFNDQITLSQIINEYTSAYHVRLITVYDNQGHRLAESKKNNEYYSILQNTFDRMFLNDAIELPVYHLGKPVGKIVLYGSSVEILNFIIKIFFGLSVGMLFVMFTLGWSINSTYRYIMQSISPIIQIARLVNQQNAYNLRFPKNEIKEFNDLNVVFNHLLEEIQSWHTHLKNENSALTHQAQHDYLTQLPNRNYFYQKINQLYESNTALNNAALIYIDNNNFKEINDQYGHIAGDEVLKEMALRLSQNVRQNDFVARLGGDEFAIILYGISDKDHLKTIAENLIKCSKSPLTHKGTDIYFSFSLGISVTSNATNAEELIIQADQAMYKAKSLHQHWHIYQQESGENLW